MLFSDIVTCVIWFAHMTQIRSSDAVKDCGYKETGYVSIMTRVWAVEFNFIYRSGLLFFAFHPV